MSGVEIVFILSFIAMLVMWIWFAVLGFRTSRLWGFGLIFLFPISVFMFAYRFERKTRQIIYYFLGSLLLFISIILYIQLATVEFYPTLFAKISNAVPSIKRSHTVKVRSLNLPAPTPIPEPLSHEVEVQVNEPVIKTPVALPPKPPRRYKVVDIGEIRAYLGKRVIVSTSTVQHQGKLVSVDADHLEVKKSLSGGSTTMSIPKSKIKKVEVYL